MPTCATHQNTTSPNIFFSPIQPTSAYEVAFEAGVHSFREYVGNQLLALQAQFLNRRNEVVRQITPNDAEAEAPSVHVALATQISPRKESLPKNSSTIVQAQARSLADAQHALPPENVSARFLHPSLYASGSNGRLSANSSLISRRARFEEWPTSQGYTLPQRISYDIDKEITSPFEIEGHDSHRDSHLSEAMSKYNSMPSSLASRRLTEGIHLELLHTWKDSMQVEADGKAVGALRRTAKIAHVNSNTNSTLEGYWGDCHRSEFYLQRFVSHPDSGFRIMWTILSCFFILYDVVMIPVVMAFDVPDDTILTAITWITSTWWSLDIILTFLLGFHKEGVVEMRPAAIALRYLRTWFIIDFSVCLSDWVFVWAANFGGNEQSENAGGILRFGKTLRVSRLIRLFRLVRLYKMSSALTKVVDSIKKEYWVVLIAISKLVFFIVMINHYIACCWFAIAYLNEDDDTTWATDADINGKDIVTKYSASLHWSLTQFTPATNDIGPKNLRERVFAVSVVLFALIIFSSFVSSITSRMTQLRSLNQERLIEEAHIREYLGSKRVSLDLGHRIWGFLRQNYEVRRKQIHELDIQFFAEMPTILRNELRNEIYTPILMKHSALSRYCELNLESAQIMCHTAFSEKAFKPSQEIFIEGKVTGEAIFVVSGDIEYHDLDRVEIVQQCVWLSEACLWAKWMHMGSCQACTSVEVICVSSASFGEAALQRTTNRARSLRFLRRYAQLFIEHPLDSLLTDLPLDPEILHELADRAFLETDLKRSKEMGSIRLIEEVTPPFAVIRTSTKRSFVSMTSAISRRVKLLGNPSPNSSLAVQASANSSMTSDPTIRFSGAGHDYQDDATASYMSSMEERDSKNTATSSGEAVNK